MPTAGHSQNSQKSDPGLCGLGNPLPNQSHLRDHTVRNILQRLSLQELHPPKAKLLSLEADFPGKPSVSQKPTGPGTVQMKDPLGHTQVSSGM